MDKYAIALLSYIVRGYFWRMKFFVRLLLFLFILFLSTPTIVSVIEKGSDTSIFYTFAEEELVHKDILKAYHVGAFDLVGPFANITSKISSACIIKHDNIAGVIFIPPPELV